MKGELKHFFGFQGLRGKQGFNGSIGYTGSVGMRGTKGLKGIRGDRGEPVEYLLTTCQIFFPKLIVTILNNRFKILLLKGSLGELGLKGPVGRKGYTVNIYFCLFSYRVF